MGRESDVKTNITAKCRIMYLYNLYSLNIFRLTEGIAILVSVILAYWISKVDFVIRVFINYVFFLFSVLFPDNLKINYHN